MENNYNKYVDLASRAIEGLCQSCSTDIDETPAEFPHVFIDPCNSNPFETLTKTEEARKLDIECQIYTSGSIRLSEGMAIADLLKNAFLDIGFSCTYGPKRVPNYKDPRICRTVIRFRGIDCD